MVCVLLTCDILPMLRHDIIQPLNDLQSIEESTMLLNVLHVFLKKPMQLEHNDL